MINIATGMKTPKDYHIANDHNTGILHRMRETYTRKGKDIGLEVALAEVTGRLDLTDLIAQKAKKTYQIGIMPMK